MKLTITLLLILMVCPLVEARLGKTLEECDALYGSSLMSKTRTDGNVVVKNYGDENVVISCRFYNNICFEIGVSNLDELGRVKSLSPERVAGLFLKNFGKIPKVNPEEKKLGANTVEHALGTDGRYVWREETTATGVITILRDNNLVSPSSNITKPTPPTNIEINPELRKAISEDMQLLDVATRSGLVDLLDYLEPLCLARKNLWRQAAEQGISDGQFLFGIHLFLQKDFSRSVEWFKKAADPKNKYASYMLWVCYESGLGVDKNPSEALMYFMMSYAGGYGKTIYLCGYKFFAVKQYDEALKDFRKIAQTDANAQFMLGKCYSDGLGVSKDPQTAISWIRKAAAQGHPRAQYMLGAEYCSGENVPQDDQEMFKWWRKAAENGLADAQHDIGVSYFTGKGVSRDYTEALRWFRKAADQGHSSAQHFIGVRYDTGSYGVEKNYTEAAFWLKKAAWQGHAKAQYLLAEYYLEGKGVVKDPLNAYQLFLLSSASGFSPALNKLPELETKLSPDEVRSAREWAKNWQPSN